MRDRATAHAAAVAARAERRLADSACNGASASSPLARHSLSLSTSTAPPRRSVVSESPELEKASTARAAAAAVSARSIFPSAETPETPTSASTQSPSASSASRAIIARRGGRMPSLRSFCRSVSSALSSRSAVSAPTLSSSPTFCTTMWISRRSCWPRRVAVNGAPGPSAATARSRSFTHAERVDSGSPPRRSMAYLSVRGGRRGGRASDVSRVARNKRRDRVGLRAASERKRSRRGCPRAACPRVATHPASVACE